MAELSTAFADSLGRNRERFNARFQAVRHTHRRLDGEGFAEVLRSRVAPSVEATSKPGTDDETLDHVVAALYDTALDLTAADLLGPGSHMPEMDLAFKRLLPALASQLIEQPDTVVRGVANAVYNLVMEPGVKAAPWLAAMKRIAQKGVDAETLLEAGKVAAWAAGMAHFRESALTAAAGLPETILPPALGYSGDAPPSNKQLLQRLQDPWTAPFQPEPATRRLAIVARAGGFAGFGGVFVEPPEVACFDGALYAFDRQAAWRIFADRCGVTLKRFGTGLPEGDPEERDDFTVSSSGQVGRGDLKARFAELAGWSAMASDGHTLAVTLPHSHRIALIAAS